MRTVFILIDALRSDYMTFENMPFLYNMAYRSIYVKRVIPSFGYCERTEIFTGMKPDKSGNFTAIGYDELRSEYKNFRIPFSVLGFWEQFDTKKYLRRILKRLLQNSAKKMQLYQIPFTDIHKFRLTEDYYSHYEKGAFCKESFFDVARHEKKQIITEAFTAIGEKSKLSSSDEKIQFVYNQRREKFHCLLLYISAIDSMGHLHTDKPSVMRAELKKIDRLIESIYTSFSAEEKTCFLILGDHGMEPVLDIIDVESELCKINLKKSKDYDVFLDSTVARFWIKSKKSKDILNEMLCSGVFKEKGTLIDQQTADLLHIPYKAQNERGELLYGDLIWAANNGILISPDYFNRGKVITGMHSYPQKTLLSSGLAVITDTARPPITIDECELIDICPTLCDLIDVPYPDGNTGISLLKRGI